MLQARKCWTALRLNRVCQISLKSDKGQKMAASKVSIKDIQHDFSIVNVKIGVQIVSNCKVNWRKQN